MNKPLTEELLHAYVDNALADEERREVERWLAQDAEAAQRVRAYLEQSRALHSLFDPVLAEPHVLNVARAAARGERVPVVRAGRDAHPRHRHRIRLARLAGRAERAP